MGDSNTDILKAAFKAFADDDLDRVMEAWHDDIRWEGTNDDRLPVGGRHEGKEDVMDSLRSLASQWSSYSATPDEFVEDGDTVVVLGHVEATAKKTDISVSYPFAHVWRFEDGKAKEVLALSDTFEIAKALGIIEKDPKQDDKDDKKDEKDGDKDDVRAEKKDRDDDDKDEKKDRDKDREKDDDEGDDDE